MWRARATKRLFAWSRFHSITKRAVRQHKNGTKKTQKQLRGVTTWSMRNGAFFAHGSTLLNGAGAGVFVFTETRFTRCVLARNLYVRPDGAQYCT